MIVVPFENWHLDFLEPEYPIFREGINWETQAVAQTLYEDGHYFAIFGAVPLWEGNVETFLFTSKKFKNRKLQCIKLIKQHEKLLEDFLKPRRAQTTVPTTNCVWQRWLEWQGYVNEGRMTAFGPDGRDHYRYAKVY
tara:strand:- start:151 stop:561 length:411 start_codon:yes stop_codon:yes gene_type:complete